MRELTAGNAMLADVVEPILRLRAQMRDELAMMTKKVRSFARSDATCRLLMTMPGVGPVTAMAFVTAVDDPARSRSDAPKAPSGPHTHRERSVFGTAMPSSFHRTHCLFRCLQAGSCWQGTGARQRESRRAAIGCRLACWRSRSAPIAAFRCGRGPRRRARTCCGGSRGA